MRPKRGIRRPGEDPGRRTEPDWERRRVIKLGALVGVALPVIITLAPLEARAEESGS